jgi:hypothetical protein
MLRSTRSVSGLYEKNVEPLPSSDAMILFADIFEQMQQNTAIAGPSRVSSDQVVPWANQANQPLISRLSRRLLLPGSGLVGFEHLAELSRLAQAGHSCILCSTHRSNLDVPTLLTLCTDQADPAVFQQIIWVASRKLTEDSPLMHMLAECFNRVVLTPPSLLKRIQSPAELQAARWINHAAMRAIFEMRHQGWIFGLFPGGTRIRPHDHNTAKPIEETDSYLKRFDFMLLCHIEGCTLPVTQDFDMALEQPRLDRVVYYFSPVLRTEWWRAHAATRYPDVEPWAATSWALAEDLATLNAEERAQPDRQ